MMRKTLMEPYPAVKHEPHARETNVCLVLRYCRVAQLCHDPLRLSVEPYNFESQMEYLAESCNVIPLAEVSRHINQDEPFPARTVAVTFDFGYRDTLHVAKQVLQRFGLHATAFVSTTNMFRGRHFWWDELEDLTIPERTRRELEMDIDGRPYFWRLDTKCNRFTAFEDIYSILAKKPSQERYQLIDYIRQGSGRATGECDCHCTLTAQDLPLLEQGGVIDIGGQACNCPDLYSSPDWRQDREISRNKEMLEEILGHPLTSVSHTAGCEIAWKDIESGITRRLGYNLAFGDSYGVVDPTRTVDCHDLPRVKVGNWHPFAFHHFLNRLL